MDRLKEGKVEEKKRKKGEANSIKEKIEDNLSKEKKKMNKKDEDYIEKPKMDGKQETKKYVDKYKKSKVKRKKETEKCVEGKKIKEDDKKQQKYEKEKKEKVKHNKDEDNQEKCMQMHAEKSTESKEGLKVNNASPHFYMFPKENTGKLKIPPTFTFIKNVPLGVISLKGPSRNTWRAELVLDSDGLCFMNGWKEFSADHQIEAGDLLYFSYDGHSQFSVLVFDKKGCDKESAFLASPGNAQVVECDNAGLGIDVDDTPDHYVADNEGSNAMDPLQALCIDGSKASKDTENDKGIHGEHACQHDIQKNGSLPKLSRSLRMTKERLSRYSFSSSMEAVKMDIDSDDTSEYYERDNEGNNATGYLQSNEKTMDHANNSADDIKLEEGIDGENGLHHDKREEMRIDPANALDTSVLPRQRERERKLADIIKRGSLVKFPKSSKKTKGMCSTDPFGTSKEVMSSRLNIRKDSSCISIGGSGEVLFGGKSVTPIENRTRKMKSVPRPDKAVAKIQESKVSISQRLVIAEKDKEDALKGMTRLHSNHPFTLQIMKASNVYPSFFMDFPSEFVMKYLPKTNEKMTLWDPQGKPWEVCYVYSEPHGAFFCRGWGAFVVGNNIEKDDICLFELFQEKNIKVGVFRVLQETTPCLPMLK